MSETAREAGLRLFMLGWDTDEIIQHRDYRAAIERDKNIQASSELCAPAPHDEGVSPET